ncbi:hypothetical protein P153DRAFT_321547 [Dothidotthia symphoricarpi CBS 119687]|uniref:Uncharacterized protein n=1 Tax=Dothidotthia symphoricarpi CBS 119687 TaxID=1392245 RepID=A0A6A6A829_9PLEO|nr:uncharacterized protein P153DRAFT_321547 [Dothidotthia symphoricarpi CBS 119687]KAF2126811.1 hypothetical protein P153DRAFT_321547 [Dothidotthia symphoricarpi CBS 119687]
MATMKPDPARQEQPRAPAVPGNRNLDTLQSMLNLVFLSSGRFVKEHHAGGGTGRMKLSMQRTVPVATERFHDALDELENEVRQAQTVLRRDLALMKQDRKKREAAARQQEVDKARLAAESRQNVPVQKLDVAVKAEPTTPAHVATPSKDSQSVKPAEPEEPVKPEEEHVPQPIPTTTTSAPTDLPSDASLVAQPAEAEFDFDAIFGDEMDTSGDTNNDNTDNNQDDMKMDTSGDLDFTLDEGPSLLRGLEDFAKSSDDENNNNNNNAGPNAAMDIDFPMPDLPDLNTNTTAPPDPPAATKPAEQPVTQPPTTTNDLLVADNLDDLFNMDEYENPENSSFDDAFFNFDN